MRVLVCMRQRPLLHIVRVNAERYGVKVDVARDGNDLLRRAQDDPPEMIVLGKDLKNPTVDELVRTIKLDPNLRGVEVRVVGDDLTGLFRVARPFPWPGPPSFK